MRESPSRVEWTSRYPDPERLRAEVDQAREAFVEALLERIPPADIAGIYFKGSSLKPWTTPLDYVPEISDVDVHVLFTDDDAGRRNLERVENGLAISQRAEEAYRRRVGTPIHTARIQLVAANGLYQSPDYVPSPSSTVVVRLGAPEPSPGVNLATSRSASMKLILDNGDYLQSVGDLVADLVGKHLRFALRTMSWRVSPIAPRVLEISGLPFEAVWTANRTELVRLLRSIGEGVLATSYESFYLAAWGYFLSGDENGDFAREAVLAGSRVLGRAIEIVAEAQSRSQPAGAPETLLATERR